MLLLKTFPVGTSGNLDTVGSVRGQSSLMTIESLQRQLRATCKLPPRFLLVYFIGKLPFADLDNGPLVFVGVGAVQWCTMVLFEAIQRVRLLRYQVDGKRMGAPNIEVSK